MAKCPVSTREVVLHEHVGEHSSAGQRVEKRMGVLSLPSVSGGSEHDRQGGARLSVESMQDSKATVYPSDAVLTVDRGRIVHQ